ncbi:MAG: molybdate ABC transporter substrate-binding protein, partial [Gracilibacteraceae bacterium]|nr:molybdate ABC transporter substrate-binding protein [Gracilibacteraceae bacterium]
KKAALFACILVFALLAGCGAPAATTPPASTPPPTPEAEKEPVELMISAAASLTDVAAILQEKYKAVAPHVTLTFTLDSSGTLQTQIEEGAPADVFISAAQKQMDALEEAGLLMEGTRKNLLENKVVMVVPSGSDKGITSFEDAVTDKVGFISIGESSVPVGQYTEEIYTTLGLWEQVKEKATFGTNVRAVLTVVETGDADCGIVYATDAASTDGVTVVCEAPAGSHQPVVYPVAILDRTTTYDEAQAFVDYLGSAEAAAVFEEAGFAIAE